MSSTRPERINPHELHNQDVVEMDDAVPGQLAIADRPQALPLADAPRNGQQSQQALPLPNAPSNGPQNANGNVQQSLIPAPSRIQPSNPPSAIATTNPVANMSPLQDVENSRAAREPQTTTPYGPSRSGRSARRALEYNTSPDKETVKRELEEQRIATRRLNDELQTAARYNENLRRDFHRQAEDALRDQQREFEQSHNDYVRMNQTLTRLETREYEAEAESQTQEVGRCREAVRREMAVAQRARQLEATQAQFEQQA